MEHTIPNIEEWEPEVGKEIVTTDVKLIQVDTTRYFKNSIKHGMNPDAIVAMGKFYINRTVYLNNLDIIKRHINYFVEFFDPDKELLAAYIHLKTFIDTNADSVDIHALPKIILSEFFRKSRIKKRIFELVEHNYCLDVTRDGTNRVFNKINDFTNEDAKILLATSTMLKFIAPPLIHWVSTNKSYTKEEKNALITEIGVESLHFMCTNDEFESISRKLYIFTSDKVAKHEKGNQHLWDQQGALWGRTRDNFIDNLIEYHLITSNLFKLNYKDNIIAMVKTIIERQLGHSVIDVTYKKDVVQLDDDKNTSGLSSIDRYEQTMAKLDEGQLILSDIAIDTIVEKLVREVGGIDNHEISFYLKELNSKRKFQEDLVGLYFANEFRGFREIRNMDIVTSIKLIIVMKRQLEEKGYTELPVLITSKLEGKVKTRLIQNKKFLEKLSKTKKYTDLIERKFGPLKGYKDDEILGKISMVINNKFSFVEYDDREILGDIIEFNEDIIADEMMTLFDGI